MRKSQVLTEKCINPFESLPSTATEKPIAVNITDEEKEKLKGGHGDTEHSLNEPSLRPFLDTVLSALDCTENDYLALLALCLIYAMAYNKGNLIFFVDIAFFVEEVAMILSALYYNCVGSFFFCVGYYYECNLHLIKCFSSCFSFFSSNQLNNLCC